MVQYIKNLAECKEAIDKAGDKCVVIDFTATWCGPCKMIGPIFEAAAKEHTELDFYKCDVDVADDVASKYQISGIPAFKFIKGGEVVKEVVGASQANLLAAIKEMK